MSDEATCPAAFMVTRVSIRPVQWSFDVVQVVLVRQMPRI